MRSFWLKPPIDMTIRKSARAEKPKVSKITKTWHLYEINVTDYKNGKQEVKLKFRNTIGNLSPKVVGKGKNNQLDNRPQMKHERYH